jgi:hypothetical protein
VSGATFRIEDGVAWVGEAKFPQAEVRFYDYEFSDYTTRTRGFALKFPNGFTLSVMWGTNSYSANHDRDGMFSSEPFLEACPDAEIAVYSETGEWVKFEDGDNVRGWCTPQEVAGVIEILMHYKGDDELHHLRHIELPRGE